MKSVQIDQLAEDFSRVRVVETSVPDPGPGQVRVRRQLSPVNPSDLNFNRGDYLRATLGGHMVVFGLPADAGA